MAKEENVCCSDGCGWTPVIAALLIAIGLIGGSYLLSQVDYTTKVNVTGGTSYPNVYVSSTPPDHEISVSATSSKKVAPDLLLIQVRVATQSTSAKKSVQDNAAIMANLTPKLKALGMKDEDIQTSSYSVDPIYTSYYICDKTGGSCYYDYKLTGYKTTHILTLSVKDLTTGGDLIDASSSVGENQTFVDYVSFSLQDETKRSLQKSLLANASIEAKSKAGNIASGMGVTLGNLLSASESSIYNYPTPNYYYEKAGDSISSAPATSLSSGQVEVSATVSASFEIQ